MAQITKIAWCDSTFNPWKICTPIGPGCLNCYAAALSRRYGWGEYAQGVPRQRTTETYWRQPLKWNKAREEACGEHALLKGPRPEPHRVFCASLADVFDNEVTQDWRLDLWDLVRATPYLSWLLVTKRVGNVGAMIPADWCVRFPDHVRLLITVCNQEEADRDIPKLLALPCKNGISYEPALGPVDWSLWLAHQYVGPGEDVPCSFCGFRTSGLHHPLAEGLQWIIVGGESTQGAGKARLFDLAWARSTIAQCKAARVPVFVKQLGSRPVYTGPHILHSNGAPLNDRAGADPAEWPEDFRIQEFPA